MSIKVETLWQSDAKNFNGDPFFSVKQVNGSYVYGERIGVDSIAFVLYDRSKRIDRFGLINERKPSLNEFNKHFDGDVYMTTAFGGSIDSEYSFKEIVQIETKEESGYSVELDRITSLGSVLVSTQMNQMCHLYMVDVTNLLQGEKDLGPGEEGSNVLWISEMAVYGGQDWKAITILTKFKNGMKE